MNKLQLAIIAAFASVAKANGVGDVSKQFSVDPVPAQKMREATRLSSEFLQKINMPVLIENAGEIIGLSAGLTASRTATAGDGSVRRQPRSVHSKDKREYRMRKINFDTAISYDDIDQWAQTGNYMQMINSQITKSKGLSLLSIGFNGTSWANNTDPVANPLLQDCGKGWLQKMREENAARVVGTSAAPVKWGKNQEFKSLDAIVFNATTDLIAEEFANRGDFVVICNAATLGDKYFTLINAAGTTATELVASDILASTRRLGGLPAIGVPYFPKDTLLITPLGNLSIYSQKTGIRRALKDEPEFDRIANYESDNLDFIVEEYGAAALIEHVEEDNA